MIEPFAAEKWGCPLGQRGISLVNVGGAQNFKHFVRTLEGFGIPWALMADGDNEGVSGVNNAGESIGRSLDAQSPEVVLLPDGNAIEPHLVAAGFRAELEAAIESVHGSGALKAWGKLNHGNSAGKGKPNRDYESDGWENRLVVDFLIKEKTGWGAAFSTACINKDPSCIPTEIEDLLGCADALLAGAAR